MAEEKTELDQLEAKVDEQGNPIVEKPTGETPPAKVEKPKIEDYVPGANIETPDATKEIEDSVLLKALSKKLGRDINSFEDMTVEKVVETPLSYASDQVASINKFVSETNRTVDDWYETQSVDYNSLSAEQLIKGNIHKNSPDLTTSEVNLIFENEYHVDSEQYEEREVAMANAKIKMRAGELRRGLIDIQNKYKLPAEKKNTELEPPTLQTQAKSTAVDPNTQRILDHKKQWVDSRNAEVEALETIKVGQFDVTINDNIKEHLTKANSNLESFFPDHFMKDGKWDSQRLQTFMYLAQEGVLEKVIGNVASTLVAEGKESVIKDRKNLDMGGIPAAKGAEISPAQQAELDEFQKAMVSSLS